MALSQHDLLRLLESLRSADGLELVRHVAERMLQELIEAEATVRIGAEDTGKAQQAFQRGLAALAQWVEREGAHRPVPRGQAEEIAVDGETEPVIVKLGVWTSNVRSRRDKLTQEQLGSLRKLGVEWA